MKNRLLVIASLVLTAFFGGCQSVGQNVIFVDQNRVGITIGGSTTQQGAELSVGYSSVSLAVVPATKLSDGGQITAQAGNENVDTLSVFASFNTDAKTGTGAAPEAKIGRVFATGNAAVTVATGIREQARGEALADETPEAPVDVPAAQP